MDGRRRNIGPEFEMTEIGGERIESVEDVGCVENSGVAFRFLSLGKNVVSIELIYPDRP